MAFLALCWLIIEHRIIPHGSLKWFLLSFYIHPFFLVFCWIFLLLKRLGIYLLLIFDFLNKIIWFLLSPIIIIFYKCFSIFLSSVTYSTSSSTSGSAEVVNEVVKHEITQIKNQNQIFLIPYEGSLHIHKNQEAEGDFKVSLILDQPVEEEPNIKDNDFPSTSNSPWNVHLNQTSLLSYEGSLHVHEHQEVDNDSKDGSFLDELVGETEVELDDSSSICNSLSGCDENTASAPLCSRDVDYIHFLPSVGSSTSPVIQQELISQQEEAELDLVYENYVEKMRWFDILSHDRSCGISAILNKDFAGYSSLESSDNERVNISNVHYASWGDNTARERLLRSLESDLELVYVAQACLSWEALHHLYHKVKVLAFSSNGFFCNDTAERFQKFQVLLERFMENERCDKGKRYWDYVQRRSSIKSLLQVPHVSGCIKDEKNGIKGEAIEATVVLKCIEKCINAFWLFIKTEEDTNKPHWWKLMTTLKWTYPPLEDLRDFNLLSDLASSLRKKKLWLKDLEGKKKKWYMFKDSSTSVHNCTNNSEIFDQEKEMLFIRIDMMLVCRVLNMSLISTPQLKWCQQVINNIELRDRKLMRTVVNSPLFPSS